MTIPDPNHHRNRRAALAAELHQFEGAPCALGHTLRYTVSGGCVECTKTRAKARQKRGDVVALAALNRIKRWDNPTYREKAKAYYASLDYKAKARAWRFGVFLGEIPEAPVDNRCECCGEVTEQLSLDHDHALEALGFDMAATLRGWLCKKCNTGIAMFDDDPDKLELAISYLSSKSKN